MNESPAARHVDLSGLATKAVDLGASRRETDAATRRVLEVKVLLYGRLAEAIGTDVELAVGPGCSVGEVRSRLALSHPAAADSLRRSRVFLVREFVRDEQLVGEDDQIEFLPPVSGG